MTRAEQRLLIAGKLLKLPKDADVMAHINSMEQSKREHLRGLVDWVEQYENQEAINEQAIRTKKP